MILDTAARDSITQRMLMFPIGDLLDEIFLLSKDDIEKLQADGENVNAMSCPYKIQPENQGKLIWISGPPGAGKSTSTVINLRLS